MQDQIQPQAGMAQVTQPAQDLPSAEPMMPQTQIPQQEEKKSRLPLILLIFFILLLIGGVAVGAYMITQKDKEAEPTATTTTLAETEETTTTTITDTEDPYEGWTEVLLFDDEYSMMIPPNWKLSSQSIEQYADGSNQPRAIFEATFENNDETIEILFGEAEGEGDIGTLGGCDIGEGENQILFEATLLGQTSDVTISECFVDGELFARRLTAQFSDISTGTFDNFNLMFILNDNTSTLEELKTIYADIVTILESVKIVEQ